MNRKDRIRQLLKGIETGDPASIDVISHEQYIQHNPQTNVERDGLAALFKRLAETNPRVQIVRAFEDGDFVFGHTEYDFDTVRIGFEVFRFEGDVTVEHWDNIQPQAGPSPDGHSMLDGPTESCDHGATEANRARVRDFVETVLIGRAHARIGEWFADGALIQHHPHIADGVEALNAALSDAAPERAVRFDTLHRVLAEGDSVLAVIEGRRGAEHTAFYHLYRLEGGRIAEQWCTIEAVPPRETWKNDNGKF